MTGTMILLAMVALLLAALELTHRRSASRWVPGREARHDRDAARLHDDLRAASQRDKFPREPGDVLRLTGRRPMLDPRLTDSRITRTAA